MSLDKQLMSIHFPRFKEPGLMEEIIGKSQLVTVEAGTEILREGSYVKTIPLLVEGLVKVIRHEGLKEMLLYYIYPKESCIVSINCGLHDLKSSIRAITEEQSTAILLPSSLIGSLQQKYPSFNSYIIELYQKRFDDLWDAYNALAFQSVDERLIAHLRSKAETSKSSRIAATHQELGDQLGTARETISRVLKKLEAENLVKLGRGSIELL